MSNPLVSIVMPVYNGARYIAKAVESALAQTYTDFKLIVVNDGSSDDSAKVIEPYLSDSRIKYVEQENRGVAAARNEAIRYAQGDLIAFLDQDDLWMPQKLERQVRYLAEHPEIALVHGYQTYIDQTGKEITNPKDWVAPLSGDCFAELFQRNRIAVLTVLLRKSCLEGVGAFNEKLSGADDYELWLRLARRFQFGFIPETLACYRIHDSNVSHDLFKMTVRELQSLESVLTIDPAVSSEIGSRIVNRRLAPLNHYAGVWYMWQEQDFDKARGFFRKALSQNLLYWPSWKNYVWCSLTASQRKMLQWYGHRLKHFVAATGGRLTLLLEWRLRLRELRRRGVTILWLREPTRSQRQDTLTQKRADQLFENYAYAHVRLRHHNTDGVVVGSDEFFQLLDGVGCQTPT